MAVLPLRQPTPAAVLAREIHATDPSIVCVERRDEAHLADIDCYQAMRRGESIPRVIDRSKGY